MGKSPFSREGMKPLRDAFRALARMLRARFDAQDAAGKHATELGLRREQVLADFLREHVPPRSGVGRGEVMDSRGDIARQCDVVVYDALHAPLVQTNEASQVFPAECVYAAIELKPILSVAALKKAVENVVTVKELDRSAVVAQHGGHHIYHGRRENPPPFGAIFALASCDVRKRLVPALAELLGPMRPELRVDCVCVLDEALVYHFAPVELASGEVTVRPSVVGEHTKLGYYASGEDTLLLFFLFLLHQMNLKERFPPDFLRYAAALELPAPTVYDDGT